MTIRKYRALTHLFSRRLSTPEVPFIYPPGAIAEIDVGYDDPATQCTESQVAMLLERGYIAEVSAEEVAAWEAAHPGGVSESNGEAALEVDTLPSEAPFPIENEAPNGEDLTAPEPRKSKRSKTEPIPSDEPADSIDPFQNYP